VLAVRPWDKTIKILALLPLLAWLAFIDNVCCPLSPFMKGKTKNNNNHNLHIKSIYLWFEIVFLFHDHLLFLESFQECHPIILANYFSRVLNNDFPDLPDFRHFNKEILAIFFISKIISSANICPHHFFFFFQYK